MAIIFLSKEDMDKIIKETNEIDYSMILERLPQTRELLDKIKAKRKQQTNRG